MRQARSWLPIALAACALPLGLSACGGSSGTSTSASAGGASPGLIGPSVNDVPKSPTRGGRVRWVISSEPDSYDVTNTYSGFSWSMAYLVCNGLMTYPDKGGDTGLQPVPDLAAGAPKASADTKTWTFTLKQGVHFSNGKVVTPADVKATFMRMLNPKSSGDTIGYFLPIAGAPAYNAGKATDLPGITISGQQITFHLTKRVPTFPLRLALRTACVVPKGTPPTPQTTNVPPTTGPYMYAKIVPGRSATMDRNPYYADEVKAGLMPDRGFVDGYDISVGGSDTQANLAIQANQADVSANRSGSIARLAANPKYKSRIVSLALPEVAYFWLNPHVAPFDNVKVRQAINYAIDREAIVKVLGGSLVESPWGQVLPPSFPGVDAADGYPSKPDLAKARALMKASGVHTPVTTTLYNVQGEPYTSMGTAVQQMLAQIGIKLNVRALPGSALVQYVSNAKNAAPMGLYFWQADYPDAEGFEYPLLCGCEEVGGSNYGHYSNPDADRIMQQAVTTPLGPKRNALWEQANKVLTADAAWVPLALDRWIDIFSSRYHAFLLSNAMGGAADYAVGYLDK
ncbi:MAG TPA: ABC transporter substrate-binding protein [Conexibacter sp.]|nr:ABC transporter substrate-binding protein [Conexibacter sp.]